MPCFMQLSVIIITEAAKVSVLCHLSGKTCTEIKDVLSQIFIIDACNYKYVD